MKINSPEFDINEQIKQRKQKLALWRKTGHAFRNDFVRHDLALDLLKVHEDKSTEQLETESNRVHIAGRIMLRRLMGKASFVHIQDMSARIQVYIKQDSLKDGEYEEFKQWDIGDIIGIVGVIFKTKTGELSIKATEIVLLVKSLHPLPDKWHGLVDQEMRYRKRYLDLIMNESVREVFKVRVRIIQLIRNFLVERKFLEVETPMMQPIPGGAAAKPFVTHHNALNRDFYLRIAPELYLKRLVVGGFERVFEINRNFRNEGFSTKHNPEFTMLEFYQAYTTYIELMNLTEELFKILANDVFGKATFSYQNHALDFSKPFRRLTLCESLLEKNPMLTEKSVNEYSVLVELLKNFGVEVLPTWGIGKLQFELFEKTVESTLIQPTFITNFPAEVSPLARRNNISENVTDRFELFVAGREIANGFSELNDPEDQAERFRQQVLDKEAGNEEAMHFDSDYITALEYGLPPTAGEGIGIDRLVMLFTDAPSIRDVLLFPQMRDESE